MVTETDRTALDWLRLISEVTLVFLIIFGNTLVIVSISTAKVLRLHRNYLLLSLAVADLLLAIFILPIKIYLSEVGEVWPEGGYACNLWVSGFVFCATASLMGLIAISLDRYIALVHPLFYKVHYTKRKVLAAIAIIWISATVRSVLFFYFSYTFYGDLKDHFYGDIELQPCVRPTAATHQLCIILINFYIPLCFMCVAYYKIWKILSQVNVKMRAGPINSSKNADTTEPTTSNIAAGTSNTSSCTYIRKSILERKGCIVTSMVFAAFVFCWLPLHVLLGVDAISRLTGEVIIMPPWMLETFYWLGYFHSSVNPFIYTMFNKDFYYVFKELMCLRFRSINANVRKKLYSRQVGSTVISGNNASVYNATEITKF